MYLRILKKDLKRKKTMNLILLIFIILAATFIASSVNNIITISSAVQTYFKKAELKDFLIITMKEEENDTALTDFLKKENNVTSWAVDENLFLTDKNMSAGNKRDFSLATTSMVSTLHKEQQKFFDCNNKEITKIKDGEIYLPNKLVEDNHLKSGDVITIQNGDFGINFTVAGSCKDAFLGSTLMGVSRFLISDNDYNKMQAESGLLKGEIYSVQTSDIKQLEKDYNQIGVNVIIACNKNLVQKTYLMDIIIAGTLLVVSVCLILIAMIILRFTIVFTLSEEFREIGIMKAIGIKERKIRGLYIIKYFAISVVGSFLGFLFSIPFGNLFLNQVSKNIVLSEKEGVLINFLFSAIIVMIVLLFCYSCTHQVNKFSPVDAIRNGSSGERFKRKGFLRLSKSKFSTPLFLSCNDIVSEPKKFGVLMVTFIIGILLIIIPINTINTLNSDKLVSWFSMARTDVYLENKEVQNRFIKDGGRAAMRKYFADMEKKLKDNGIDTTVSCETVFKFKISFKDYSYQSFSVQGTGVSADQYAYTKGQAPMYENEVALTHVTADKIGAKIGDTVKIKTGDTEKEYIVTGMYQSMTNVGEGIRFSEKAEFNYKYGFGSFAIQIKYKDNPTEREKEKRFDQIKKLYPDFKVRTGGEYISSMMGNISSQIESIKRIIISVILIINMLVAVLMVKTFLTKEKGEIGMLKSLGFRNSAIMKWQVMRVGIILIFATFLGAILSNPVSQISSGKIFEMMGSSHIEFDVKPLEVYFLYPSLILIGTLVASGMTALQVRRISTQETNNIE